MTLGEPQMNEETKMRYRVTPRTLPKVQEQHYEGIFGDFDDVIDLAIARNEASRDNSAKEAVRFFQHLKVLVDREKFAAMQIEQLSDERLNVNADLAKYIDPVRWFESKVKLAKQIGLDKSPPLEILDIGTGPGHFPTVAQFYGHSVLGTDLPLRAAGRGHLYDELGEIYNIRRKAMRVDPFKPLPEFDRRFDLVTAFLAAFNVDADKKPWSIEMWDFFLTDLRRNVLKENGGLYMSLTNYKLTQEVWDYLTSFAEFANHDSKLIYIKDFSRFD